MYRAMRLFQKAMEEIKQTSMGDFPGYGSVELPSLASQISPWKSTF